MNNMRMLRKEKGMTMKELGNVAMKKSANPQECYIGQKSMLLCYCYIVQYSVAQWHKLHAQVGAW